LPAAAGTIPGMVVAEPKTETFLQFARRTCANQGTRPFGSGLVVVVPAGHRLPDYLGGTYGRSDPPTAAWAELRAYLLAEGAPPKVVEDARKAWRAWERRHARAAQLELDL
jgi:hypothetical protein